MPAPPGSSGPVCDPPVVDAWNPAYGTSFEQAGDGAAGAGPASDGPAKESSAQVDTMWSCPRQRGAPCPHRPMCGHPTPSSWSTGRRIDAGLWTEEDDGLSYPGLAASYARSRALRPTTWGGRAGRLEGRTRPVHRQPVGDGHRRA